MKRIWPHFVGLFTLTALAVYLFFVGHIPLIHFWVEPTWPVGMWLLGLFGIGGMAGWLWYAFSYTVLWGWLILVVGVHGALWFSAGVQRPFQLDGCLDAGGVWRNDVCHTEDATPLAQ